MEYIYMQNFLYSFHYICVYITNYCVPETNIALYINYI